MGIEVTPAAAECFRQEWGFEDGEQIRIFVRYVSGGETPFALGITRDVPQEPELTASAGSLTFYMERRDVWFLEGRKLVIDCEGEDIVFRFADSRG